MGETIISNIQIICMLSIKKGEVTLPLDNNKELF